MLNIKNSNYNKINKYVNRNNNENKILVVIPAYNEENTIYNIIKNITNKYKDIDILVIDDCSNDNTKSFALNAGAKVISHCLNSGAWCAIQTGFRYAVENDYDIVVTMDADGQHIPEYINDIIQPIIKNESDLVIGSYTERGSKGRKFVWSFLRHLSGINIMDITSGFRAYNKKCIKLLISEKSLMYEYQDLGIILLLLRKGMRIKEIPVVMKDREKGHSRIFSTWLHVIKYTIDTSFLAFTKRLFKNRKNQMISLNNSK